MIDQLVQSKKDLEEWHKTKDAWGYETNPDDAMRKKKILDALGDRRYKRALDIGAGEGFITRDLPADEIHAIEVSDNAAKRLPEPILRVPEPQGDYDLIIATGVFYDQYDWRRMHEWIKKHAVGTVLTSNIKAWEHPLVDLHTRNTPKGELPKVVIASHTEEYPYREYTQVMRIYEVPSRT